MAAILMLFCGCSDLNFFTSEQSPKIESSNATNLISSVRLYLAKGSLTNTEFEQFSLSNRALFFECGNIRRGRNIPAAQGVVTLSDEQASEIVHLGMEILGRASVNNPENLSEQGDLQGFADSGKVLLILRTKDGQSAEVNSGLIEVSEPITALEEALLNLAQALRAQTKDARGDGVLCGNETFFGID